MARSSDSDQAWCPLIHGLQVGSSIRRLSLPWLCWKQLPSRTTQPSSCSLTLAEKVHGCCHCEFCAECWQTMRKPAGLSDCLRILTPMIGMVRRRRWHMRASAEGKRSPGRGRPATCCDERLSLDVTSKRGSQHLQGEDQGMQLGRLLLYWKPKVVLNTESANELGDNHTELTSATAVS